MTSAEQPARNSVALASLRIAVGCLFLVLGEYKVLGREFAFGGGFEFWINRFLSDHGAYPFMVPVLRDFVLPHARPIAILVAGGEVALGLSLTLGLWSRVASVCGLIYMLTLLFSANYPGPAAPLWQYFGGSLEHLVLALCFGAFALGQPAAVLSVPAYLRGRRLAA
ncbi:MAG: DoxX family protein [Gemmatimonadales bacterium]